MRGVKGVRRTVGLGPPLVSSKPPLRSKRVRHRSRRRSWTGEECHGVGEWLCGFWWRRPSGPPLVSQRRPSVAQSAWSLEGGRENCDHADCTPAACFADWRTETECEGPREPGIGIVRSVPRRRIVVPAQCRARQARTSAIVPRNRIGIRKLPAMIGAFDAPPQFVRRIARHTRGGATVPREFTALGVDSLRGRLRWLYLR